MLMSAREQLTNPDLLEMVGQAMHVRAFESLLLDLFKEGRISGTVHTCIGQEFCAAALHRHLRPGTDAFFATHRGHGHYICHGGPVDQLLAELMGRDGALCLGRGGTQNLAYERFFSAGIQGGSSPIGTGYAWALSRRTQGAMVVIQVGDGTLGEGTLYEAFTFAALLKAPVLFLLEHNGWAQSTDTSTTTPGDVPSRAAGFGLRVSRISDSDPAALSRHLSAVVETVRKGMPTLQIIDTRRLMPHSKGDDSRPDELLGQLRAEDPLTRVMESDPGLKQRYQEVYDKLRALAGEVSARPLLLPCTGHSVPQLELTVHASEIAPATPQAVSIVTDLNFALDDLMGESRDCVLIGEDLLHPYGGAFKVSRGLSEKYPTQVLSTPIAEAGIIGMANGMALAGMRPIAEVMFADFATLCTDQIVNFAAKFHYMYGGKVSCPVTIRLPSGGGRGYGPTHSQSLESLFFGVPGLRIVALSHRHACGSLLSHVVKHQEAPTIVVEHKVLYPKTALTGGLLDLKPVETVRLVGSYPPLWYSSGPMPDITIVTYGGAAELVENAIRTLVEQDELHVDYLILTQLWPLEASEVIQSVKRSGRLVVVEEGVSDFGVGAAITTQVAKAVDAAFRVRTVGASPVPLPSARHLEDAVLPSSSDVVEAVRSICV
jgi:2-oxoisovalerate dehydrogenase E1 component